LRAAAPAARAEGDLARVAATTLSGAGRARDEPGGADAGRPRLRQRLWHPHARRRPVRAAAGGALRARAPSSGLRPPARAGLLALRAAPAIVATGQPVLAVAWP